MERGVYLTAGLMLLATVPSWADQAPVAVSPGGAMKLAVVEDRCPTFSWGEAEGAESYELMVYRFGEEGEEVKPVLRKAIPGSALAWTPSLDRCLERGGAYAWSIRAVGGDGGTGWSPPSLFQVATGPSRAEFEEALAIVRNYLTGKEEPVPAEKVPTGRISAPESSVFPTGDSASAPAAEFPPPVVLSVDGSVGAAGFQGDGTGLTGVDAATLGGSGESAFFRLTQDETITGRPAFNDAFTVGNTMRIENLNADRVDGIHGSAFHRRALNSVITGRPSFNGGASGLDPPFFVDSTFKVTNLNADLLDGFSAAHFIRTSKVRTGTTTSSACTTTTATSFGTTFGAVPVVVITPEGRSGTTGVPNTYCVIDGVITTSFSHCCWGNNPDKLHWIAIGDL